MKKTTTLLILFISILSASFAREIKTAPAYDNIHNSNIIFQQINPIKFDKYALLDKSCHEHVKSKTLFSDNELDKINLAEHTVTSGKRQNYIQKITLKDPGVLFPNK
jgi:hypothetical protein